MTYMVSSRVFVLNEIVRGLDTDIKVARARGEDTSELEAERKRRANERMMYLNAAVKVTRKQTRISTQDTSAGRGDNNDT